jgi:polyhydroxybutyrate depolymerase
MFMKSLLQMSHCKMRTVQVSLFTIIIAAITFSSCKKDVTSKPPSRSSAEITNLLALPQVDAGPEKVVVYPSPSLSTTLVGSGSSTEGPVTFQWKQIGGSSVATIAKPTSYMTNVTGLTSGIYTFALTVTDVAGRTNTDTTCVSILKKMTWTVGGVTREALVHIPTTSTPGALIIGFHGHGGTDVGFAQRGFETGWPNAIVVYPQGLPTKSYEDPQGLKPGWQYSRGEINYLTGIKDQDLLFFDAIVSTFQTNYHITNNRVFVHGWSNGGMFVYNVLWPSRGDKLTAISSASAVLLSTNGKKAMPVMQIAGTSDPVVSFNNQQKGVQSLCTYNQCITGGSLWASGDDGLVGTRYWSSIRNPVFFVQYNGGHSYPDCVEPLIVKFFKQAAWITSH